VIPFPSGRWSPRKKAELVAAIDADELTTEEAAVRYALGPEELAAWRRNLDHWGVPGLRTRIQCYPHREDGQSACGSACWLGRKCQAQDLVSANGHPYQIVCNLAENAGLGVMWVGWDSFYAR